MFKYTFKHIPTQKTVENSKEIEVKKTALEKSYNQNVSIPPQLHKRAMKFFIFTGANVPAQIRAALNEYLIKHNY